MEFKVVMPRLGSEMTKGTIVEWLKKEGESVAKDETLFVVDTEKANIEVESEVNGVVTKILVNDNTLEVAVGETIALIETDN